ncbi:MAG TPA: hypothetical protein VL053_11780 [Arachidicoccus sp.]|nr:hypothetical protein [Arachidicoccus sp.]
MTNFTSIIRVDQTPEDVLIAIGNVRGWWPVNIEGKTGRLNGQFTHRDRYLNVKFKITQLKPQRIVWDIVNSHNNMFLENRHEWNTTRISFDITPKAGKTEIKFTFQGLVPELACYKVCSKAWSFFITSSLKGFIEKGKAGPISNDYGSYNTSYS